MINVELFCCSGGMAEGFRRAGIEFDLAVDFDPNHCDSYGRNLGHRPEQLDVRVLLEQLRRRERVLDVDLLVADPPCTPWSRAGKRLGVADERDMLEVTCEIIAAVRPRRYLIGNVPGLEDGVNLHVVHRTIGALSKLGYCVADFLSLDAANYGTVCPCPLHDSQSLTSDAAFVASTSRAAIALGSVAGRATTPHAEQPWVRALDVVGRLGREIGRACAGAATPAARLHSLRQLALSERATRSGRADDVWTSEVTSAFAVMAADRHTIASIALWLSACWDDLSQTRKWSTTSTEIQRTTIRRISKCIAATVITGLHTGTAPLSVGCGLCVDAGVPQHRKRPFWFGHLAGPCLRAPAPTHCDPLSLATLSLPGITPLKPWVTCRDALGHLSPDELGCAVKMRRREQNGKQLGSIPDRPARVVGTSNLSDGNVISAATTKHPALSPDLPATTVTWGGAGHSARPLVLMTRHEAPVHTSNEDEPARSLTTQCRSPGHASTIILNDRHRPADADADAPAPTLGAKYRGQGAQVLTMEPHHPPSHADEPAMTIRAGSGVDANRATMLNGEVARRKKRPPSTKGSQSTRTIAPDAPSTTVQAREDRKGSGSPVLEWPWPRPATTLQRDERLAPPGHHDEWSIMSLPDAVILSERAAAILQGFPPGWVFSGATKKVRWGAIGMAMPPALAEAVARAIVEQHKATRDQASLALEAG